LDEAWVAGGQQKGGPGNGSDRCAISPSGGRAGGTKCRPNPSGGGTFIRGAAEMNRKCEPAIFFGRNGAKLHLIDKFVTGGGPNF